MSSPPVLFHTRHDCHLPREAFPDCPILNSLAIHYQFSSRHPSYFVSVVLYRLSCPLKAELHQDCARVCFAHDHLPHTWHLISIWPGHRHLSLPTLSAPQAEAGSQSSWFCPVQSAQCLLHRKEYMFTEETNTRIKNNLRTTSQKNADIPQGHL